VAARPAPCRSCVPAVLVRVCLAHPAQALTLQEAHTEVLAAFREVRLRQRLGDMLLPRAALPRRAAVFAVELLEALPFCQCHKFLPAPPSSQSKHQCSSSTTKRCSPTNQTTRACCWDHTCSAAHI